MQVPISFGDRLREARLRASKDDPRMSSLEKAAEVIDSELTGQTLGRYELDKCNPSNERIKRMAVVYNAPELLPHYCATVCPMGKGRVCDVSVRPMEQITLRLYNASRDLDDDISSLMHMTEDGVIDDQERPQFDGAISRLEKLRQRIDEALLMAERRDWTNASAR